MKKIIFDLKAGIIMCCLFLISSLSANAQALSLGTTNAVSISGPTLSGGVYIYNVVIPYYATDLTGAFSLTYSSTYTCGQTYYKYITLNKSTGQFVANSSYSNSVNFPGAIPGGANNYIMRVYCANSAPDLPSILKATLNIRINVLKELEPHVNLNFAPYCKYIAHSNPQQYSGYIGFNVTGNYASADKLYLRVTNLANTCATADYKVTWLHNSNAATATINPTASFYDCAANTTYTIKLVYKSTGVSGNIEQVISTGQIGWNEYSWKKTFKNCLNLVIVDPDLDVFGGKKADGQEVAELTKKFNLYPNPTNSDLNILSLDGKQIIGTKVFDPNGFVYASKAHGSAKGEETINISHLRPGIYFVEIETNEGVFVEKVVKN